MKNIINMGKSFERGSEWRKWDLHVHTPESGLSNQFKKDWDAYVKALFESAIDKDIAVIGITDYFTIDGYKKLKNDYLDKDEKLYTLFSEEQISKIKKITILPNIEFRLHDVVKTNRINYHVIFSDEVSIEDIEENFLHDIDFVYEELPFESANTRKLKKKNLEEFGAKIKKEQPSFTGSNFSVGCTVATIQEKDIRNLLMKQKDKFAGKYLIVVPVDEDLSEVSWNGQDHQVRKGFYQHANMFFATNQSTIDFALGNKHKTKEEYLSEFKSFKPCICGSDAHKIDDFFNCSGNKFCWIKADPTFDGLKQLLCEPKDRVKIQEEKPDYKEDKNVIEKVRFISPNKIFSDKDIHFNQNLNVIIGGKSSGKSMLLYSIANTLLPNVGDKLLYKEDEKTPKYTLKNLDADFDFEVTTLAGISQKISEREKNSNSIIPDITYIPQNELVKLAEPELNGRGESLNKLVRHLICEESESKQLYDDFINKVQQYDTNRNIMIDNYFGVIDVIQKLENELKTKPDRKVLETNINTNTIKVDELNKKSGLKEAEIIKFKQIIEQQALCRKNAEKITIDNNLTQSFLSSLKSELSVLKERKNDFLNDIGDKFSVYYEDKLGFLQDSIDQVDSLLSEIKLSSEFLVDDIGNSKNIFLIESNLLIKEENELRDRLKPYFVNEDIQKQIKTLNDSISSDKKQLEEIELLSKAIEQKKQMQEELKNSLFGLYGHTYNEYVAIVNSLKNRTDELENDGLQINGVAQFNFEKFRKEILYFTDGRSASNRNYDILDESKTRIAKYEFEDIKEQIQKMFDDILSCKYIVNNKLTKRDIVKRLLDDYYYDYWEITYKEDRLGEMSTGKASFVILMLIIGLSKSKSPILIDQPEDNLDNRSVSENVISYLRKKKTERQIILVTHNANIVVNADSENVIVANQKGQNNKESSSPYKFDYINGSIENSFPYNSKETDLLKSMGIKEHVADIVEGGKDAFEKREKKYGFN